MDTWLYGDHLLKIVLPKSDTNVLTIPRARVNQVSDKLKRNLYYIKFPMHKEDFQPFYTTVVQPFLSDSTKQLGIDNLRRIVQPFTITSEINEHSEIYNIHLDSIPTLCNKLLVYYQ